MERYFTVQLPLDLIGYNIYMHVVLEWIKWYRECFNLQDATEMTAINAPRLARCIGGRGGSATTTESSEHMTQVSPIWMNIQ